MGNAAPRGIEDADVLASAFGHWPPFHDAEVLRITLQRDGRAAFLACTIHVFSARDSVAPIYPIENLIHVLVTLRFDGITSLALNDFDQQNVIDDLNVESYAREGARYEVYMPANNGSDIRFFCNSIRIVSVEPWPGPDFVDTLIGLSRRLSRKVIHGKAPSQVLARIQT